MRSECSTLIAAVFLTLASCSPPSPGTSDAVQNEPPNEPRTRCVEQWKSVANGAEYKTLGCPEVDLHLVRVDPKVFHLDAVMQPGSTAQSLARSYPFVLNANFFDEQYRPLGVVVSGGKPLNRVHPVSWQSVFFVTDDGRPAIELAGDWDASRDHVQMAVQCGPRLYVDGKRTDANNAPPTNRAGVCITPGAKVIFFATPEERQLSVGETMDLLGGLGCREAMLFDGGPSVQLHLAGAVDVEGDKRVPAFVVGKP
ncbi:MAG TPA: phosphodiester glycosidase family protein [Thermoanaerobaculia bacterium]|jgi:uncharacterized protein YigE (DUF2233 family)